MCLVATELPLSIDLVAYRGDSWEQGFRFLRGSVPVNLANAVVESEARSGGVSTPLVTEVVDAADGRVQLRLPADSLPPQTYDYDVEVTEPGTGVTTWVRGTLTVIRDVTNELGDAA